MSDPNEKSTWAEITAIGSILLLMLLACGGGGWYFVHQSRAARARADAVRRDLEIMAEKERIERENRERGNRERESETDKEGE
jgi:hypothetical protein